MLIFFTILSVRNPTMNTLKVYVTWSCWQVSKAWINPLAL